MCGSGSSKLLNTDPIRIRIGFSFYTFNVQFKYAKPLDVFLIVFGLVLAFGSGSAMPIMCIMFGDTLQV